MKVNNIQNYYINNTSQAKSAKQNIQKNCSAPSFVGALAINFWDAVAR